MQTPAIESPRPPEPNGPEAHQLHNSWQQITASLNTPLDGQGHSDSRVAHRLAALTQEAETTGDPVKRAKDLGELQAALKAMQGDPALNGTIAEADRLLEGTNFKIAQTPAGEVWDGTRQADGTYTPNTKLSGQEQTGAHTAPPKQNDSQGTREAADDTRPAAGDDIPRVQSYNELQEQHRRDAAAVNNVPVEGSKSDEQAAQRIAALAEKIDADRYRDRAAQRPEPDAQWKTKMQLMQELHNLAGAGDPELLKGTLAAANKILEQRGLKFGLNEGRIVEGKKWPGHEANGYQFETGFDMNALKYE